MNNPSNPYTTISQALAKLRERTAHIEDYERMLWSDNCKAAGEQVKTIAEALEGLQLGSLATMAPRDFAVEQAEEARLQLVAFAPHVTSTRMSHLRQRQEVAASLTDFIKAVERVLQMHSARGQQPRQRRERPAYLRLVPSTTAAAASQEGGQA